MEALLEKSQNLMRAFGLCILAYAAALGIAIMTGFLLNGLYPVYIALAADAAATLAIYIFGRIFKNASFYDPYWSIAPIVIAIYWSLTAFPGNIVRQFIVLILVLTWSFRLTSNWARQWRGLKHEDWRYVNLRDQSGRWFWFVDLFGIEMMPTIIVFIGCLSLFPALTVITSPFSWLDVCAMLITAGAIIIEAKADEQLKRFVSENNDQKAIMSRGLWSYSRHPNYFGEIAFWWGLYIFALAADTRYWWTIIGPIIITLLFLLISIPLMEKRNLERRPEYTNYQKMVSVLIPWFHKA